MSQYEAEIKRRRTFAIISHPDAGKTTLTEKFLLYGGAIAQAGQVKGKKNTRAATSDWMEIEKQRGISVTSSVMQFQYEGYCINILDTPGHQDFSEDTYRTLMAADSAVMVIDAAKGVEAQTRKLFKVCAMRDIPIFTFINKMDREARDSFELLEELEKELGIETYPVNWPIGCGKEFQGVYDRGSRKIIHFTSNGGAKAATATEVELGDPNLDALIGGRLHQQLTDEIELLDGAAAEFDLDRVRHGKLSPVFFGSALTNFGVEPFLEHFLQMTTAPLPRRAGDEIIDSMDDAFSAFVFKIQANMNKAHRDRIAFMRIVSGKFEADREVYHVQGGKKIRLSRPQQLMAAEREIIEEAYAGDIIGVFDPGIFSIGDTLCTAAKKFTFDPIPTFAPEHFKRVRSLDTMKRKQFGGRHPDLQDPLLRHGGGHRGRGGHPAVRRAGVPAEKRVQRGFVHGGPALRVPAVDRDRRRPAGEGGGPDPGHRHQAGGGLQGQPAAAVRLPVGGELDPGAQQKPHLPRVWRGQILMKQAGTALPSRPVCSPFPHLWDTMWKRGVV